MSDKNKITDEYVDEIMRARAARRPQERVRKLRKWLVYTLAAIGALVTFVAIRYALMFLGDTVSYTIASLSLFGYLYFMGNKLER